MKLKIHRLITTGAVLAAFGALSPTAHAQSSDAIVNKLVQKGILTQQEADELQKESNHDFSKAFLSNMGAPSWVSGYKFGGDFRGRFDYLGNNSAFQDNYRLRYRIRAGLTVNVKDDFQVAFRLGSGDAGGNPLSNNTTMENNGTKKPIWVDAAYAKWTPLHDGEWSLTTMIGKMDQPFQTSPMVFDPDYTPEGAAVQAGYKINNEHSLRFNGGGFVLDQLNSRSPALLGAQAIWDAKWTPQFSSSLSLAAYDILNKQNLGNGVVPNANDGNTRDAGGNLVHNYNPVVAGASLVYTADSFPLYHGKFPIKLAGEFMDNPAAPSQNNQGYWGGIVFGAAGKKGNWDIAYRYQYLEGDAWYEELVNDDNVGYHTSGATGSGFGAGMRGGTNVKGHLISLDYSITDALTFSFNCYANSLINNPGPGSSSAMHAMVDLMWKF